ncbi:purine-cytosine permease family protein [Streptomyces evansiae]|uniref:purine-cytosine permease family protein n=1 Tax=Streptomyces evansiae TaxID=3075535 RepID=UPI0028846A87|nr:cytosine permease [Streptomyces sp. DSM 41859]MDT0420424.1 cytosine permease [Streptomyces sp. DSM 41859]
MSPRPLTEAMTSTPAPEAPPRTEDPATTRPAGVVETSGAEPVPEAERHGHPRQLLWTWAAPQVGWATAYIGVLAVAAFGLGFTEAVVALVLGAALGAVAHGFLSVDGPRFGVPQMVLGRLSFGHKGNVLPSTVNALVAGIGWFAMNTLGGAFALNSLTGLPPLACLLILVALEVVVGYVGHDLVHRFERYALPVLAVIFLLAGVWIFKGAHLGHAGSGGGFGAFLLAFSASFGFTAGWNPCASDYARYLPRTTSARATGWYAGLGLFLSVSVVSVIGAASGTVLAPEGASPTDAFTGQLPGWLAHLTLLAIILGGMAASTLNVYSASVSLASLTARALPRGLDRATLTAPTGAVGTIAAWASLDDAGHAFESFLLVIAYWTAPWLGVVLVEQWRRRRTPDTLVARRLSDPRHTNAAGLIALLAGVAVSVPLFSHQEMYVGPLPAHWPGLGDLTCPVGFAVSALLHAVLARTPKES